jgi:glutamine synthetase
MNPAGEELQALLARYPEISSIELLVPDLNGILRGKRVHREEFAGLVERGLNMPRALPLLDSRGRIIEPLGQGSRDGDPDTVWHVVPGSLSPVPWCQPGLGQHCVDELLAVRRFEGLAFDAQVSDMDYDWYLRAL